MMNTVVSFNSPFEKPGQRNEAAMVPEVKPRIILAGHCWFCTLELSEKDKKKFSEKQLAEPEKHKVTCSSCTERLNMRGII